MNIKYIFIGYIYQNLIFGSDIKSESVLNEMDMDGRFVFYAVNLDELLRCEIE